MRKIRLVIADDQVLFRKGLAALIEKEDDLELVAEGDNGQELLDKLRVMPVAPDVAIVDMHMPVMNGVELNDILHQEFPDIKVVVLSVYDQERFISKMIEAGASGYLIKNTEVEELLTAVRKVHDTGFYFNQASLAAMKNAWQYRNQNIRNLSRIPIDLTDREREVLRLICKEYTNNEMADALNISVRTVEGHRNNLLAKTGCKNTAGLVVFAIRYEVFNLMD
ncbi:MAG TPA: response regulator transcription factor [Dinghuibacter sp.]|jgi:DNA-binding NarL/FixJ family response regulator|uniref:response regulator transcription factor n=1 Tax=Dinghuibacter sp. TaxID=2024697 RepID=UPI002C80DBAF|nr:response regulator transcription factor [Dinghuibacter sp.]HTJ10402.1 response regulator transcription factor [Dinghuibacter sp.]